jgi:hypothetical protein
MKKKVISWNSLPFPMPVHLTLILYLLLDRWDASQVVWGIAGTLVVLIWIAYFYSLSTSDYVDILNRDSK